MMMNGFHALYRFFADDGRLLYVGITNNPAQRWDQHAAEKPWWHEVRGITLETYPDRDSVLAAERRAIQVEQPVHNKVGRRRDGRKAPMKSRVGAELEWICEACGLPVKGESGYLHVSNDATCDAERRWQAHEDARNRARWTSEDPNGFSWFCYSASEILSLPGPVKWQVHHRACDPRPDANDYWIHINRADTFAKLLHWSGHLMEKSWIEHTNWSTLMMRMGRDA